VPGSGGGEQSAIDRLGRLALEFLDAADSGEAGAASAYEAIAAPLERSYHAHRDALDRLSKGVIDADGDLDALYESPAWREHQQLAAQALYYLNWLHYRGALLYDGAKRKSLLEEAANGFGEFATARAVSPVVAESHLGRGLAYLELDKADWAIADFEAVAQAKDAPPERVRKARLALAEAYIKAGRSADALRASKQALDGAGPADEPRAKLTRARALLMAAAGSPGDRAGYRAEASSLLSQLQSGGGPWGNRAAAIVRAGLDNPKIWAGPKAKAEPPPPSEWEVTKQLVAGGKYKEALPRLERLLASSEEEDRKQQPEARYLLGIARFRLGDPAGASEAFEAVLAAKDRTAYRDDAAYLNFKAREALYAANATPERLPAYEQAIATFVTDYPKHKAAPEARYRLGEIRQRQERYADAIAQYAQVHGDPAFEMRAAFATAQSSVKLLESTPEDAKADPGLRHQAEEALGRFWSLIASTDFTTFGDAPVNDLMGQAALMNAYLAALAEPPDYEQALAWLGGYEERYPKLREQEPQVVKLRLAAVVRLGRLADAAREAERPAVAELDPGFLDDLATRLLTTAARVQAAGKADEAAAGKQAALRLSERALASANASALTPVVRRRLRSTAAALYEERGERDKALALYREILADEPDVLSARAGAARVLEAEGKSPDARALWDEIAAAPPERVGWLEAHYQSARLSVALGDAARACTVLREVPPKLIANANSDTPKKIQALLQTACPS
jgi:tetratricopeptide (TPR) repeat protein